MNGCVWPHVQLPALPAQRSCPAPKRDRPLSSKGTRGRRSPKVPLCASGTSEIARDQLSVNSAALYICRFSDIQGFFWQDGKCLLPCRPTKHRNQGRQLPLHPSSLTIAAAAVAPAPTYDVSSHSKEHLTIGTIGHVDHGKTTLTAAITRVSFGAGICFAALCQCADGMPSAEVKAAWIHFDPLIPCLKRQFCSLRTLTSRFCMPCQIMCHNDHRYAVACLQSMCAGRMARMQICDLCRPSPLLLCSQEGCASTNLPLLALRSYSWVNEWL